MLLSLIQMFATLLLLSVFRSNTDGCAVDDRYYGIEFEEDPLGGVHVIKDIRFQSPAHQVTDH